MKVIVAGMPKTGTKTLNAALSKLGYSVYDSPENAFLLTEEYRKIIDDGWTIDDFRKMYENVDAIVDFPAYFFWDEIHKAFPEARIILTLRDSEDEWVESMERQVTSGDRSPILRMMEVMSPTWARTSKLMERLMPAAIGIYPQSTFRRKTIMNKPLSKRVYRQHNAYVLHNAPKDKLLVFKCTDGWGLLCEFLGVTVPDEPFPHKNKNAELTDTFLDEYPVFRKVKREIIASTIILTSSTVIAGIALYKYGISGIVQGLGAYSNRALLSLRFSD